MAKFETDSGAAAPHPPRISISTFLRRALVYLRPYWRAHLIIGLGVLPALAFDIGLPYSLRYIIDFAIHDLAALQSVLIGLAGLFVIAALGRLSQDYAMATMERSLKRDLRLEFFSVIQNLPIGAVTRAQPGEFAALFAREIMVVRDALRTLAADGLQAGLQLAATIVLLAVVNLPLTLLLALIIPLTFLIARNLVRQAAAADYADKVRDATATQWVQDNVQAQPILRAFGLNANTLARFRQVVDSGTEAQSFWARFQAPFFLNRLVTTFTDLQQALVNTAVVGVGAVLVFRGSLTVGEFLAFFALQAGLGKALSRLSEFVRGLVAAAASLTRLDEVRAAQTVSPEPAQAIRVSKLSQGIQVEHVSFRYQETPTLADVTLTIPAGKTVALVGRSGSGKSTLLNLLLRLYEPNSGTILFDSHDLRHIASDSLHTQIGLVPQDSGLLNLSVRENIRLAQPEATQAEIEAAARLAEIHEVIRKLPRGYDTVLSEGGRLLSPGQRQRVALARAILRDPALLLLDEATAALDPETESKLFATFRKLATDRTMVVVTHRLAAAASADYIYVLDQGQVVEHGTPRSLLLANGLYQQLWQLQSGFIISDDGNHASVTTDRLRAVPLFVQLDDSILENLAAKFVVQRFTPGYTILEQGDIGERFYIIVRGQVKVTARGRDEKPIHLATLEDGEYFGEIALLEGGAATATVVATLPTLCLYLRSADFQTLLEAYPEVRTSLSDMLLRRSLAQTIAQGRAPASQPALLDRLTG